MMLTIKVFAVVLLAGSAWSQDRPATRPAQDVEKQQAIKKGWTATDAYPLDTCVVTGEPLGKNITVQAGGRTFKLCCKGCIKKVKKSPEIFAKKLVAAVIAQQSKNYPLKTCPISKEKLGSMGKAIEIVLDNQLIKLCCKGCVKKAGKNKVEIIAKIQTLAYEQQKKNYSLKTCPVSKQKLGSMGKPYELMHGTTLVKLCCKGCLKKFQKSPTKYLAKPMPKKPASRPSK